MSSASPTTIPAAGTLYVLDAHGLLFQMFHAIPPSMSAPDGRPTNAVFGVVRALMDLYDKGADYLIAAWDVSGPTFRDELYSEYKGHRPPPPPDLLIQEPMIHRLMEAMRIPFLTMKGFEADDIMATLAAEGSARGLRVFLCTSDKDCRQCLNDNVSIANLRKGEALDAAGLKADWGIEPKQVVDFQAMVGDSVDNVPGVPGCGPKTAAKWLAEYGTLDNIIANVDKLGGPKLRDAVKKSIADGTLELSRTLVRLRTDVPLEFDWVGWKRRDWDGQKLLELCQEYGFRSYANKVRAAMTASGAQKNAEILETVIPASRATAPPVAKKPVVLPRPGEPTLFDAIDGNDGTDFNFGANVEQPAVADNWVATYHLVDTPELFADFLKKLKYQKRFVFDLETTGLAAVSADIVGFAFCWEAGEAYYLPLRGPKGSQLLDIASALAALAPIFADPTVGKLNQNIKYDQMVLRAAGLELKGVVGDPMIAHYLLHSGDRTHNLDELARNLLQHENISITSLIGKGKSQKSMADVPTEKIRDYAGEDADVAFRLAELLEPQLAEQNLRTVYDELELPLIEVLADLEFTGIRLDVPFLKKLSTDMDAQLAAIEDEIYALAGRKFNIASPAQLREILFDEMKLKVQKKTNITGEASTNQESLERLAALGHALPVKIIEHRQIAKLKGTYVDALPELVEAKTGRIHTSFNQTVAATGRLSSSDPNLQNIPARTEMGKQIRQAFLPKEGWVLLTADYSQVELRLLAHFCGDENLQAAFAADRDIHAAVAAEIYKVPEESVSSAQRRAAKTVNFGVIYGISAFGLGARLGLDRKEAEKFINDYFARYPKVLSYQNDLLAKARANGYVATILGRRRPFDPAGIRAKPNHQNRTQAEREAINMEIQGSAADLMKKAMLAVHRRLREDKIEAKMLLTVHDELVFEVPPRELSAVADLARTEMAGALSLSVPLKVDVAAGPNWLDGTDL